MMSDKPPQSKPAEKTLSLGEDADSAVKRMFSLSPAQSRRIIARTSPNPKAKPKKK
jgi:hypothetical protein